jgi:hypothetical protein
MRFPRFTPRKKDASLNSHKETVFAEASKLAQQRLEQCIADLHSRVAAMNQGDQLDEPATANNR